MHLKILTLVLTLTKIIATATTAATTIPAIKPTANDHDRWNLYSTNISFAQDSHSIFSTPLNSGWRSLPWNDICKHTNPGLKPPSAAEQEFQPWSQISEAHRRVTTPRLPTNLQVSLPFLPLRREEDGVLLRDLKWEEWGGRGQAMVALFRAAEYAAQEDDAKSREVKEKELQERIELMELYNHKVVCYYSFDLCNSTTYATEFTRQNGVAPMEFQKMQRYMEFLVEKEGLYRLGKAIQVAFPNLPDRMESLTPDMMKKLGWGFGWWAETKYTKGKGSKNKKKNKKEKAPGSWEYQKYLEKPMWNCLEKWKFGHSCTECIEKSIKGEYMKGC